jgi:redox-sensitive bicupin YhaK (pirin superfamily)
MITLRPSAERGHADHGWLNARHSFSFADYYDPKHMGFRSLRVINEDRVAPGMGFGTHPHRDMEILTYILSGRLAHKDSMGNGREIAAGQLQAMSAGTGITHSEFNPSREEPVHLLQIWLLPDKKGHKPRYAEWSPAPGDQNPMTLLASPDGRDGSAAIHQDALLLLAKLPAGASTSWTLRPGRATWIQVARGNITLHGGGDLDAVPKSMQAGDGAAIEDETSLTLHANEEDAEVLIFDLA